MDPLLAFTFLLGLYLAWNIGGNDFANSMGDAVGSRAITVGRAVVLGGLSELLGSILAGSHVTHTVRGGIVDPSGFAPCPEMFALGMMSALFGTALWLHVATWMGVPVSTTHAIVGGVAGFGLAAAGWHAVSWAKMGSIVASWVVSPVCGAVVAFLCFKVIVKVILGTPQPLEAAQRYGPGIVFVVVGVALGSVLSKTPSHSALAVLSSNAWVASAGTCGVAGVCALATRLLLARKVARYRRVALRHQLVLVEGVFAPLVVLTSCSVAFAHGANDVANAVGPVSGVLLVLKSGAVRADAPVPWWLMTLGGCGIVVGLATYGYRVMQTVGTKITQLTPSRGVAADVAASTTVMACTLLGLPVSTTHVIVGAIVGVGFARGLGAVDRRVVRHIVASWLVTVPVAGLLTALLFLLGQAVGLPQVIRASFP